MSVRVYDPTYSFHNTQIHTYTHTHIHDSEQPKKTLKMDKLLFYISDNKYILAVLVLRSGNSSVVLATESARWDCTVGNPGKKPRHKVLSL